MTGTCMHSSCRNTVVHEVPMLHERWRLCGDCYAALAPIFGWTTGRRRYDAERIAA